jgi:hypothetical protein
MTQRGRAGPQTGTNKQTAKAATAKMSVPIVNI